MTYINIAIGMVLGLCFFICVIKAYTVGLKHGKELSKGNVPEVKTNPVKTFKEYLDTKEEQKKVDLVYEGWHGKQGIMNYNPYEVEKE